MSTPPVRPARPADDTRIRELQQYLREPSPALLDPALDALSTDAASLAIGVDETWRLLVTPDNSDEPVGYLLAIEGSATHIAELVVDPAHRRQKRATALLESVCESTRHPVTVCVAADNEAARLVYKQLGFTEVDRRAEQFDSGDGLTLRYDPQSTQ